MLCSATFDAVKHLLVLCLIFIGLASLSSVEARVCAHPNTQTQTGNDVVNSSNFQEHSANICNCSFLNHLAFKARSQRLQAVATNFNTTVNVLVIQSNKHNTVYNSPLYLPLIRLLLYPKHYFW